MPGSSVGRLPEDYCAIACNTNGYDKMAALVEVAAVKVVGGRATEAFRSFIATDEDVIDNLRINADITEFHLANAPALEEVMTNLLEFIGDMPLIGAKYSRFIKPYIERDALKACGVVMENKWRDVLWLGGKMGAMSRDSITDLCEHLHIKKDRNHRALSDAIATWQCWECLRLMSQSVEIDDMPDWIYHGDIPCTSLGQDTDSLGSYASGNSEDSRRKGVMIVYCMMGALFILVAAGINELLKGSMMNDMVTGTAVSIPFIAGCVCIFLGIRARKK
ncbi:MAG TPA: 3'-5' exonuclease [Candidatus Olsenella pullicola]|nr:3'-5' exonuclease [Candidatus Olsenella pullicola]